VLLVGLVAALTLGGAGNALADNEDEQGTANDGCFENMSAPADAVLDCINELQGSNNDGNN
jgi:hypothetical protein